MTDEQQLKLQAFFDGELPEAEAREVAAWLARDADATALLSELRHTRKALADFEPGLKVPESREFYWSKIQRQIERLEPAPAVSPPPTPWISLLRRWLMPAGAFAVLMIAGFVALHQSGGVAINPGVEVALTDHGADAFTYRDESAGTTLVWFSYSGENKFTDDGARATLQPQ